MQFHAPNQETLNQEHAKQSRETAEQEGPRAFYLKPGITQVKILPPFSAKGVWYRELQEYSFLVEGQRRVVSAPAQFGLPDPVVEKRQELIAAGGEANMKLAKELQPRRRFIFNALISSAPAGVEFKPNEVYVLKTGVKLKRAFLNADRDAQGGFHDITNPEAGVTFRITRTGAGLSTTYEAMPMANRSSIAQDLAPHGVSVESLQLHQLDELYQPKSYEELALMLAGYGAVTSATPQPVAVPVAPQVPIAPQAPQNVPTVPETKPTVPPPASVSVTPPPPTLQVPSTPTVEKPTVVVPPPPTLPNTMGE